MNVILIISVIATRVFMFNLMRKIVSIVPAVHLLTESTAKHRGSSGTVP